VLVDQSGYVGTIKSRTSGQLVEEELLGMVDTQLVKAVIVPVAQTAEGMEPLHLQVLEPG